MARPGTSRDSGPSPDPSETDPTSDVSDWERMAGIEDEDDEEEQDETSDVDRAAAQAQDDLERAQEQAREEAHAVAARLQEQQDSAQRDLEQAEQEAQEYLYGSKVTPTRVESAKKKLGFFRQKYQDKMDSKAEFNKNHPIRTLVDGVFILAPLRAVGWLAKKTDNFFDWALKKLEDQGEKAAPKWFTTVVNWALWPVEKHIGRQTDAQADAGAKDARGDKKDKEKLQKAKAKKEAAGK